VVIYSASAFHLVHFNYLVALPCDESINQLESCEIIIEVWIVEVDRFVYVQASIWIRNIGDCYQILYREQLTSEIFR